MDKAPDAYRTISEVADDLDLQQHVLRFWESRFSQIKPLKRGGGRRYYRPDDVELLKGIRHLLYKEGYTIKGVQRILKEQGVRAVQAFARGGQEEVVFEPEGQEPVYSTPVHAQSVHFQPSHPEPSPVPPAMAAEPELDEAEPEVAEPAPVAMEISVPPSEPQWSTPAFGADKVPAAEPVLPVESMQRGQVSMFRGGLQRPDGSVESASAAEFSERMRAQLASPSQEDRVPTPPGLGARASLQLALDELLACRARIDRLLARS